MQEILTEESTRDLHDDLRKDLEITDVIFNFKTYKKMIISKLVEYNETKKNDTEFTLLSNQFVLNEDEKCFENFNCNLKYL